jgi:hypothetical protein
MAGPEYTDQVGASTHMSAMNHGMPANPESRRDIIVKGHNPSFDPLT